ncbi:hypothetical protein HY085_03520 [Candidatus Gottesmanbacteria bacterium]|nr:hypothetical protein [Candidatus Gottesmanbacteria bacterium]
MAKIGKVSHYFDKIGVAALTLTGPLALGETVKIGELTQVINSMQIDRVPVEKAKTSDDVAIKVDQKVKEGMEVEKV